MVLQKELIQAGHSFLGLLQAERYLGSSICFKFCSKPLVYRLSAPSLQLRYVTCFGSVGHCTLLSPWHKLGYSFVEFSIWEHFI